MITYMIIVLLSILTILPLHMCCHLPNEMTLDKDGLYLLAVIMSIYIYTYGHKSLSTSMQMTWTALENNLISSCGLLERSSAAPLVSLLLYISKKVGIYQANVHIHVNTIKLMNATR